MHTKVLIPVWGPFAWSTRCIDIPSWFLGSVTWPWGIRLGEVTLAPSSIPTETGSCMPELALTESELIQRAASGDSDAFGALVTPHLALFHNGIQRILGNTADTQDALQDALISIHRDLPRFEGRSRFSSWGYKVCLNAALMVRRSRVRIQDMERSESLELGPFDARGHHLEPDHRPEWQEAAQAHVLVEGQEMRECLTRALDELPDTQRIVFILKDLEDWETEDIAVHLQLAAGTVRQRLHRARLLIQARLKTYVTGGRS